MSRRNLARTASLLVTALLLHPSYIAAQQQPAPADSASTIHVQVNLLSVAVRVTDRKDNEVRGLRADQFSLYENGVAQKIAFFDAEDEPISLGILLDVSGSMELTGKLDRAKESLTRLVGTMRPDDELFYLRFHRQVDKITDFTSDPNRILSAISATGPTQDGTSLYDAIATALCYMRNARHRKRALLVVTDGADQNSHRSLDDLIPIVQASEAQVFVLGCFSKDEYEFYRSAHANRVALVSNQDIDNPLFAFKRLANESGAEAFFPAPDRIEEAIDAVAHRLRTQYTLAYYPSSEVTGFRRVEVKVAMPGARVRTRTGFGAVQAAGPSTAAAGCDDEHLKPYPYESKVTLKNGLMVYHDDFQDRASGWPTKSHLHYGEGTYEIGRPSAANRRDVMGAGQYSMTGTIGFFAVGELGTGGEAAGQLVANGPWFNDLNVSVSVELKPSGDYGDLATAAGLVFHLNARGYYAVILSNNAAGPKGTAFKLIKKFHSESRALDLIPWTEVPVSELLPGPQKKISVQCRGDVITINLPGMPVTQYTDNSTGSLDSGLVGMVMFGTGRAIFRDLTAEEVAAAK